jgi:flagellar biosynthesis component FlhA
VALSRARRQSEDPESAAESGFVQLPKGAAQAALPQRTGEEDVFDDETLTVALDAAVLYRLYRLNAARYRAWWTELRNDFLSEIGGELPELRVIGDAALPAAHYAVYARGVEVDRGEILLDSVLVEMNPSHAEALGLEVALEAEHPLSDSRVFWAVQSPALRRIVDAAQIRVFDFMEYVLLRAASFFQSSPEDIITITAVHGLLRQLEKRHPGLLLDAFQQQPVNVARLTELLQYLVREGVGVRDFRAIVEAVATYCMTNGVSLAPGEDLNFQDLLAFVRLQRRRALLSRLLSSRRTLKVVTMSGEIESLLDGINEPEGGAALPLDGDQYDRLRTAFKEVVDPVRLRGALPVSLLCRGDLRAKAVAFLQGCARAVRVVTYEELDPALAVEPVGVWRLRA